MSTIKLTQKQLKLIQDALELYSRIGMLELDNILHHPSIDKIMENQCTPKSKIEIGDMTSRGEVVEIGIDYFKTKGVWFDSKKRASVEQIESNPNGWIEEVRTWHDMNELKHAVNYSKFHQLNHELKMKLKI